MAKPTPNNVYRAQQELTRRLTRSLTPLLSPFLGLKISTNVVLAITRAIFPAVQAARAQSRQLARAVYLEALKEWDSSAPAIAEPGIRQYVEKNLETAVSKALDISGNENIEADDLERVVSVADLHTRNAYRNSQLAHVLNDDNIVGWARIDPEPPTCEFCRLLISRGPVYKTEKSAGGKNKFHIGCTCIVQKVFRGQEKTWIGRDQYLAERKRYQDATRGKSGKEARRAWREAVAEANGRKAVERREASEQAAKQLPDTREAELKAARAQLRTLEAMNPSSDSAKRYKARQMKVLRDRISRLESRATG